MEERSLLGIPVVSGGFHLMTVFARGVVKTTWGHVSAVQRTMSSTSGLERAEK